VTIQAAWWFSIKDFMAAEFKTQNKRQVLMKASKKFLSKEMEKMNYISEL
jgi:hypothetical protein